MTNKILSVIHLSSIALLFLTYMLEDSIERGTTDKFYGLGIILMVISSVWMSIKSIK